MTRRAKGPDAGVLSRKRTADLLRQLRKVKQQTRALKAEIEAVHEADRVARRDVPRMRRR